MKSIYLSIICLLLCAHAQAQISFSESSTAVMLSHQYDHIYKMGGGIAVFDYDNDGDDDIYATGGNNPDELFENDGNGNFTKVGAALNIAYSTAQQYTTSVTTGDINNDGIREIFVGTIGTNGSVNDFVPNILLYKDDVNGNYTDIAPDLLLNDASFCMGANFIDVNLDGRLDLYIMNYVEEANYLFDSNDEIIGFDHDCGSNKLYINLGGFYFEDRTVSYGLNEMGCGLAVAATDLNDDQAPDLLLANDFGEWLIPNQLFINDVDNQEFSNVSQQSDFDLQMYAMGFAVGDFDNDEDFDFYITNLGANALLRNEGNLSFSNIASLAKVNDTYAQDGKFATGWGTTLADFDNDTWLDLFVANGFVGSAVDVDAELQADKLFRGQSSGVFLDSDASLGFENLASSRGAATGDFDSDGRIDLISIANHNLADPSASHLSFYKNNSAFKNWIGFELEGSSANKDAYGAIVKIYSEDKTFIRSLSGGESHASQNSSRIHFGLGNMQAVEKVEVIWPGGTTELILNPKVNEYNKILQGSGLVNVANEHAELTSMTVFPNPFNEILNIIIPNLSADFQIFNIDGRLIYTSEKGRTNFQMNTESLPAGIYIIKSGNERLKLVCARP